MKMVNRDIKEDPKMPAVLKNGKRHLVGDITMDEVVQKNVNATAKGATVIRTFSRNKF